MPEATIAANGKVAANAEISSPAATPPTQTATDPEQAKAARKAAKEAAAKEMQQKLEELTDLVRQSAIAKQLLKPEDATSIRIQVGGSKNVIFKANETAKLGKITAAELAKLETALRDPDKLQGTVKIFIDKREVFKVRDGEVLKNEIGIAAKLTQQQGQTAATPVASPAVAPSPAAALGQQAEQKAISFQERYANAPDPDPALAAAKEAAKEYQRITRTMAAEGDFRPWTEEEKAFVRDNSLAMRDIEELAREDFLPENQEFVAEIHQQISEEAHTPIEPEAVEAVALEAPAPAAPVADSDPFLENAKLPEPPEDEAAPDDEEEVQAVSEAIAPVTPEDKAAPEVQATPEAIAPAVPPEESPALAPKDTKAAEPAKPASENDALRQEIVDLKNQIKYLTERLDQFEKHHQPVAAKVQNFVQPPATKVLNWLDDVRHKVVDAGRDFVAGLQEKAATATKQLASNAVQAGIKATVQLAGEKTIDGGKVLEVPGLGRVEASKQGLKASTPASPKEMWDKYSQGLSGHDFQKAADAAKKAIQAGHTKEEAKAMIASADPRYQEFAKQSQVKANNYARTIVDNAAAQAQKAAQPKAPATVQQQDAQKRHARSR